MKLLFNFFLCLTLSACMLRSDSEVEDLPLSKDDISGNWEMGNRETVSISRIGEAEYEFVVTVNEANEKTVGILFDWGKTHLLQIRDDTNIFLRVELKENTVSFYSISEFDYSKIHKLKNCQLVSTESESFTPKDDREPRPIFVDVYMNKQELHEMLSCNPDDVFPTQVSKLNK